MKDKNIHYHQKTKTMTFVLRLIKIYFLENFGKEQIFGTIEPCFLTLHYTVFPTNCFLKYSWSHFNSNGKTE